MEDSFKQILGRNIRKLRKIQRMRQLDLEHAIGYESTGMISQVERGEKGMSNEKIYAAAKALGVPPSILFEDQEYSEEELEMAIKFAKILKSRGKHPFYSAFRELLKQAS